MMGELSPASVYVSLLPVVEACVVVAVPGRVGEVRVAADEPEAVDLDPGVLARRLDAPATVEAVLDSDTRNSYSQFGLRGRAPRGVTGELSPASVYVRLSLRVHCVKSGFKQ